MYNEVRWVVVLIEDGTESNDQSEDQDANCEDCYRVQYFVVFYVLVASYKDQKNYCKNDLSDKNSHVYASKFRHISEESLTRSIHNFILVFFI